MTAPPTHGTNWPKNSGAPPLYATPRNPDRPSTGPQIGVIASALGTPFIPWQSYVADVTGERNPDGSYAYPVVVITVPRQTGKTTLIRAVGTHSALVQRRDVFYTAQTGKDARARWADLVKTLQTSPVFADRFVVRLRGGSEHVEFPSRRTAGGGIIPSAVFQCFAPTPESLHGYTPPKVFVDEAFAQTEAEGELLMGAVGPAQFTITDKQLWIVSTAGTAVSTWFHDWVDRGMDGAAGVACFVWGASDEHDPYDPAHVEQFHPGVGFELNGKLLTAADVIDNAGRMTRSEYERAYANRRTVTTETLIPPDQLAALTRDLTPPDPAGMWIAYDVDADRQAACILAGWLDPATGHPVGKIIRAGAGSAWLASAVADLDNELRPAGVVAVDHGPVVETNDQLERDGVRVTRLPERAYAVACSATLTRIESQTIGHDGAESLMSSFAGLVTRPAISDGLAFTRRNSTGSTAAAIAFTIATHQAATADPAAAPVLHFRGA